MLLVHCSFPGGWALGLQFAVPRQAHMQIMKAVAAPNLELKENCYRRCCYCCWAGMAVLVLTSSRRPSASYRRAMTSSMSGWGHQQVLTRRPLQWEQGRRGRDGVERQESPGDPVCILCQCLRAPHARTLQPARRGLHTCAAGCPGAASPAARRRSGAGAAGRRRRRPRAPARQSCAASRRRCRGWRGRGGRWTC